MPAVALMADTAPLAGAAAPVHVTGMSQLAPVQPAVQVPQVYPPAPIGVHPVMLWRHGSGLHASPLAPPVPLDVLVAPPVPLEVLAAPPVPLDVLLVPPVPLDVLLVPPVPLDVLDVLLVPPVPLDAPVPFEALLPVEPLEPQSAVATPSARTESSDHLRRALESICIGSTPVEPWRHEARIPRLSSSRYRALAPQCAVP